MTIFELPKDALLQLSESGLEELLARLAEADLASVGESPARVYWSGSINSPDGGVDVQVDAVNEVLDTGFLARSNTILQAKKQSMAASAIKGEMSPKGKLSPTISEQAAIGGSYIIVSLADDCSPTMKKGRLQAMRDAVKDDPDKDKLHLDFYDRSKLLQWLRQHPAVMLWVRGAIGQAYSGWQPYAAWSNPPAGTEDTLIQAPGVSIIMPSDTGKKLSIDDAIGSMRDLIRSTNKAIRVTGLSGVGKTRIVQSLFEEGVGEHPLDRTCAIYVDAGANPDPSAHAMLERLIAENRRAIMVLDNCPSDLHSALAQRVSCAGSQVSLITVEYDIREDKPQTTEVIHIEAEGPDVAEQLLIRRFPGIGQVNARKIAEFANGNARVSLAVAERVDIGESLAHLSDAELFDRLFQQRKQPDDDLRAHAELLSLVYSFSVVTTEEGLDELAVLASIYDVPRAQLFRSVGKLFDRHIAQKRSHWCAILPHAIANRLAGEALHNIPAATLRASFEVPGRERLLTSFSHRLGLMHDHPVAREIVEGWLQQGALFGQLLNLNEMGARILEYIAPVAPDVVLDRIEGEINEESFRGIEIRHTPFRSTILNLLQSLAYEPQDFERCVDLLLRVGDFEDETNNYGAVRDRIFSLFQAYLSGTHASIEQRLTVVRKALRSGNPKRRSLGFRMLSTALDGPPWTGSGINDFGARPRDFGFRPNHEELVNWRNQFMDLAVELSLEDDPDLAGPIRSLLARHFRGLWRHRAFREKLIEAAQVVNASEPWVEGWKAVRSTIYFDYLRAQPGQASEPIPEGLTALAVELAPKDLMANIRTYVLGRGHDHWALADELDDDDPEKYRASQTRLTEKAEELGEAFACSNQPVSTLGKDLFHTEWMPYRFAFGRGMARGASDRLATWSELVQILPRLGLVDFNFSVLSGFIDETDSQDRAMAQALLDQCLADSQLRADIVRLHPTKAFNVDDFRRCVAALDYPRVGGWMYGDLLWRDEYAGLPRHLLVDLALRLLDEPNGDDIVLDALSMKLHSTDPGTDTLGKEFRSIGLQAATHRLLRNQEDMGGSTDYRMEQVVGTALSFGDNDDEKTAWLDAIFSVVDERCGHMHTFGGAIQITAEKNPGEFLYRFFSGDQDVQRQRRFFIERGETEKLPLGTIDIGVLIDWCQTQGNREVWPVVAASICDWVQNESNETFVLSDAALQFLEIAPDSYAILESYARRIKPRVSSGDHANVMQGRAAAIAALGQHHNGEIAAAARKVVAETTRWIEAERQLEARRDQEREQKFE